MYKFKFDCGKLFDVVHGCYCQICHVLYPGDATVEGKLLRLKQQYTLCSASIQDIIARYKEWSGSKLNFNNFPSKVAIQMNDTHPTLCIPELMRILMDCEGLPWDQAWDITRAYVINLAKLLCHIHWT